MSLLFNLFGSFIIISAVFHAILPLFVEVDLSMSVGKLAVLLLAVSLIGVVFVKCFFFFIRSTLFTGKKKSRTVYWKVGTLGGGAFGLYMILMWWLPEFGPRMDFPWWVYGVTGVMLIIVGRLLNRVSKKLTQFPALNGKESKL